MGDWQAADSADPVSLVFLASPEVPVPMDLPDWGNRNDNVEPNGFTTRGRSARCRICPPIAVMIRCVAVHA